MSRETVELTRRAFQAFNERDLGEFMILRLRLRGRGAESDTPIDAVVWHVNQFRDGRTIRWRVYTSEDEAIEAVGLPE